MISLVIERWQNSKNKKVKSKKISEKIFQNSVKLCITFFGYLTILILIFYTQTEVYDFPITKPFAGKNIYNPYQNTPQNTIKANFHAHSKAWGGLTNGHNSAEELLNSYKKNGYAFAGISNYFEHNKLNSLQVYEHGINIAKSHLLAINSQNVDFFDYPLFQKNYHKQHIINRLRSRNAIIAVAHPAIRNGHGVDDMYNLVGYHFTEVLNHYTTSEKEWDTALKSGKLSWIMANDDTHDINKEPTHKIWNETFVTKNNSDEMLKNMLEGKNYGIISKKGVNDLAIKYLNVKNDSIYFDFGTKAKLVKYIIDGRQMNTLVGGIGKVYFPLQNGYIRFVVTSENGALFTNPIVRYSDEKPQLIASISPTINLTSTYIERVKYYFLILFIIVSINIKLVLKIGKKLQKNRRILAY